MNVDETLYIHFQTFHVIRFLTALGEGRDRLPQAGVVLLKSLRVLFRVLRLFNFGQLGLALVTLNRCVKIHVLGHQGWCPNIP